MLTITYCGGDGSSKTEKKRKQIWNEIVKAEDRAYDDAQQKYPLPEASKAGYSPTVAREQLKKQAELKETLTSKYKNILANKYDLTRKQLDKIAIEGLKKEWPFPK